MYYEIFIANVLRLLEEKQMTKQALAQRAGMSMSFLSDLTNGKANPSLKIMAAIASALEVALPSLLQNPDAGPAAAPVVRENTASYRLPRQLPQGMAQVAALLTAYQAFHVRQWDQANRKALARSGDGPPGPDGTLF